jgi:RNA polymerase II C-terminal domain phosphatase-like 1/2
MNRLGLKVEVFESDARLGELDYFPVIAFQNFRFPNNEIRIHHRSFRSERCPPLSILQSVSAFNVRCKLDSSLSVEQPLLINLHASMFHEMKVKLIIS